MQLAYKNIQFLVGDEHILEETIHVKSLEIFHTDIIEFLGELSSQLLKNRDIKKHPDIAAFAFWIRKKNLENEKQSISSTLLKIGRGMIFHITPSNIPIQFAVSLVYGLLSGNSNVVRISDKTFEEVDIICSEINKLLNHDYVRLKPYISIIRYGHDDAVTKELSSFCDGRVIWGGDHTIQIIRRFPISPRAVELCFADRDSLTLIQADRYLEADPKHMARIFFDDTYYVDQNACSSPRLVVWMGERIEEAKERFWSTLKETLRDYELSPVAGSEKLLRFCLLAEEHPKIKRICDDNKLVRIETEELFHDLLDYKSDSGYFFEYNAKNLEEILPLLRKTCQTIAYYGFEREEIRELIRNNGVKGVDRIVPMGHALGMAFFWDGFDMLGSLSRTVNFE